MQLTRALAAARRLPENYHNMPKRFVDRHTTFIAKRMPRLPQYMQKIYRYKLNAYYDQQRPWEEDFRRLNAERVGGIPTIYVEPIRKWAFFRGDRVEVIRGVDKGKQGLINYIVKERNWVFVHGLNLERELINQDKISLGNVTSSERPYLINLEVKLVDPTDFEPTDFEWRYDDQGNRVRVSTRTERIIPIPEQAYETIDYVEAEDYREQPKDTLADAVKRKTFVPAVKTFEMDICDEMGIKDDRVPYPMYWY